MLSLGPRRLVASLVAAAFALEQAACTSKGTANLAYPDAELAARGGMIELRDDHGTTLPVTPDSKLAFHLRDGSDTRPVEARHICRAPRGFTVRRTSDDPCDEDTTAPLASFEEIESVTVETFDRAATTLIVAGVVVVAVAAIVIVASATKGSSSSSSSSSGSGSSSRSSPSTGSQPGRMSLGGGGAGGGGGGGGGGTVWVDPPFARFGAHVFMNLGPNQLLVPLPPASNGDPSYVAPPAPGPLFSDAATRRATVQGLVALEGSVSAFTPREGATSAIRGGVRLFDFVDLLASARFLEGGSDLDGPRFLPTAGLGFHGELPRARWAAFALGLEAGTGGALRFYASGTLGLRFGLGRSLWLGLYPVHPAYADWSAGRGSRWVALSSMDLALAF